MIEVFNFPYYKYYLFIFLLLGLLSLGVKLVNNRYLKIELINFLILAILGFCNLGLTIGLLVGNSRESVMNVVISSILTLIGVMSVYLFTGKTKDDTKVTGNDKFKYVLISSILIFFPLSLMYGVHIGSTLRIENIQYEKEIEVWFQQELNNIQKNSDKDLERYKKQLEIEKEKEIIDYKKKK